ncbi:hypothetical protein ACHWQZ_G016828 [Mnemiopsis leidyi]
MLDAYPLPNLDELAHKVAQFSIYSSYDLKSAYHQVPLHELDKIYTAFEASGRLYQFTRIPFGVTNGVAAFQRFMDSVIDSEKTEGIFAYLDNITIGGIDQADHDSKVERFEQIVSKYGLTLNHSKTISSVKEIGMLGYLISKGQIKPDPARMKPLLDLPTPCDHASLKRVLGLFSYYSKWVPQYSDKIRPLISSNSFPLSKTAVEAFELVKKCIHESCIVSPNDKDLLVVETDASGYALSASLNQNSKPVAFFSRTLNQHEKLHSAVEKEACAIVEAVRKWRHYLSGRKFLLVTDQQAVSFLFSKRNVRGTAKNEKIARWRVELSCFDFEIKYRPGTANLAADCLSRAYCAAMSHPDALSELHIDLCHPGITPHERLFNYTRKSSYTDTSHLPNWLTEKGKVLLKRHVRSSKYEDLCDEVELLETNPTYARVKLANGVDKTVSLRDLAPLPRSQPKEPAGSQSDTCVFPPKPVPSIDLRYPVALGTDNPSFSDSTVTTLGPKHPVVVNPPTPTLRKSQRLADPPDRLNYDKLGGP